MQVNLKRNLFQLALATFVAGLGMGCGGLSASQSISPATFLLPGLGQTTPNQSAPEEPGSSPLVALNAPLAH